MFDSVSAAASRGDVTAFRRFVAEGVDPSVENNLALRKAVENGHFYVTKLLLGDPRVDTSVINLKVIQKAVEHKHREVIDLLVKDPRIDPYLGLKAFEFAMRLNDHDLATLLLRNPRFDPSLEHNQALKSACYYDQSGEIVRLLLRDPRVDPTVDDEESATHGWSSGELLLMEMAVDGSSSGALKALIEDPRVDPSCDNNHIVRYSVRLENEEATKILLNDPRVDPGVDGNTIIRYVVDHGSEKLKRLLMNDLRVDPSVVGLERSERDIVAILKDPNATKLEEIKRADKSIVTKFKQLHHSIQRNQPICGITHNSFKNDTDVVLLKCNHVFEKEAYFEWYKIKKNCPICRADIDMSKLTKQQQIIEKTLIEFEKRINAAKLRAMNADLSTNAKLDRYVNENVDDIVFQNHPDRKIRAKLKVQEWLIESETTTKRRRIAPTSASIYQIRFRRP